MKKRIGISLILALLMIVSTFAVGTVSSEICGESQNVNETNPIDVTKKVFDGEDWVDELVVEVGQELTFNITITYYKVCGYKATEIQVVDSIDPVGLSYILDFSNSEYQPSEIGNPIVWNLTEDYGVELFDGESVSIEYNLTVTSGESGEIINAVSVYAKETCCQTPMYGEDTAKVIVEEEPCIPIIEVNKTVWDGEDWVEYLDGIKPEDIVKFKIDIIYNACDDYQLLNMEITDYLPDCLEYNDWYEVTTTGYAEEPTIVVDGKTIYWNWVDTSSIILEDGDSLTVIFETVFTEYCCDCSGDNCVYVKAWGCQGPQYYFEGDDCATVNCQSPQTTFDKYVKDGEEWVKEIETYVGNELEFKIELVYYGKEPCEYEPLTNIKFVDELPCILEYIEGTFNSNLGENLTLEVDGKILYFNASDDYVLNIGETITITFKAEVVGCTDCGCDDCEGCEAWNIACVTGGCQEPFFEKCDEVKITSVGNCPPSTPDIGGRTEGKTGEELVFSFYSEDSDEDQIIYYIDWGDESEIYESELMDQGVVLEVPKIYEEAGVYTIKAKAVDEHGATYGWTYFGDDVTITDDGDEKPLCIQIKKLCIGRVRATIKNIADEDLNNVIWNISFAKSGILFGFNVQNNGTITTLAKGQGQTVETGPMFLSGSIGLFKFGLGTGKISVKVDDYEKTVNFQGLVFAKLVLITKIS